MNEEEIDKRRSDIQGEITRLYNELLSLREMKHDVTKDKRRTQLQERLKKIENEKHLLEIELEVYGNKP